MNPYEKNIFPLQALDGGSFVVIGWWTEKYLNSAVKYEPYPHYASIRFQNIF